MLDLKQNVQYVKGIGPKRVKVLNSIGIYTLYDLLTYFPRDYEDRTKTKKIIDLVNGEEAVIEATAMSNITVAVVRKNMSILKLTVGDETGVATITWFNQLYLKGAFKIGEKYKFYGKVSNAFGKIDISNPVFDRVGEKKNTGKIVPIYPLTYNLSEYTIRQAIENALNMVNHKLEETLPSYIINDYKLDGINNAMQQIHFPTDFTACNKARNRLVFEELLTMQLALMQLKNQTIGENGICYSKDVKMSDVINELPFKLTKAQLKVLEEIDNDMESTKPMSRLLQGDVGSGKTIVSIIAAYKAAKCGYQSAIMAPTAILASQHIEEFKKVYPDNNPADVLFMDYKERDGQLNLVKKRLEIGGDVWNWLFKKESDFNGGTVAWHCSEIPFVFHNVSFIEASFEPGISDQLEDIMCQAWVNMAYSGNPNGGCVPEWNKMQKDNIYTMIFDEKCKVEKNHDIKLRELLKKADK